MHADKPSIIGKFLAAAAVIWAVNYAWVQWQGYPFAYCLGLGIVEPLKELLKLAFWVVVLVFVFFLATQRWGSAFAAALLIGLVSALPNFADAAFRLGRTCN